MRLLESFDKPGDPAPWIARNDRFTFLDLRSAEVDMRGASIHDDNESRRIAMCLNAAGFAMYGFEANAFTVEFFPNVSGDFQLAFFEGGQCHRANLWGTLIFKYAGVQYLVS